MVRVSPTLYLVISVDSAWTRLEAAQKQQRDAEVAPTA